MNFSTTREQGSLEITELTERKNSVTGKIIGAAIDVHRTLGPGLLESAYETCLAYELRLRKLKIESQKAMPIFYKDVMLDCGYRADLIVNDEVIRPLSKLRFCRFSGSFEPTFHFFLRGLYQHSYTTPAKRSENRPK